MTDPTPTPVGVEDFLVHSREFAVLVLDAAGCIVHWQGAAAKMLGYTAAEMRGRSVSELFTPEDRALRLDELELELARTSGHADEERWLIRKDGSRIWASGALQAIPARDGGAAGFVKILRDRTDARMRFENTDHQLRDTQAALQRTQAFVRMLGHEMRNPLGPILNAATILRMITTDERGLAAIEMVRKQAEVLKNLAEDLVDVARIEGGRMTLRLAEEDLCAQLRDIHAANLPVAQAKGVELRLLVPDSPLRVCIDKGRFWRALHNLVGNAIKYTPAGGRVWVKATREGDDVVAKVEDTGIGIGAEMLPRIFELFTRSSQAQDHDPGGLGIGLPVVKEIVELHRGGVTARSSGEGQGSEFTIRLPALARWRTAAPAAGA